jgi:uncharacterized membrane protein YfcA
MIAVLFLLLIILGTWWYQRSKSAALPQGNKPSESPKTLRVPLTVAFFAAFGIGLLFPPMLFVAAPIGFYAMYLKLQGKHWY